MKNKPDTETDIRTPAVSDLEHSATTPPLAPIDPFLGFRVDKKERNALFYRWFWRGAALSIISTILIAANIHVASIVVWSSIAIVVVLLSIKQKLIDRAKASFTDQSFSVKDYSASLKKMFQLVIFIFGHGVGLLTMSFFVHIMVLLLKHTSRI